MQPLTVFASVFPGEALNPIDHDPVEMWVGVPFGEFAIDVSAMVERIDGYVLILHGAEMVGDDWATPLIEMMEMGASVVSPFIAYGDEAYPPDGSIASYAYFTHTEVLRRVGGLDTRVLFGHHRLLVNAIHAEGGWVADCDGAVARLTMDPARMEALGALYYRQIEDDNTIKALLEAS